VNRYITVGLIACAALSVSAAAMGDTGFLNRSVKVDDALHRYQVYVPSDYTRDRAWPVIVDLHGNGAQGEDGIRQTAHFLPEQIRLGSVRFPVIVVFPQASSGMTWTTPQMQEMVLAELTATVAEFRVDTSRVYLSGFSMGGTGVYAIASRSPDRFAALVAIAGSPPTRADALPKQIGHIPCWIFHGESDERVPVALARTIVAVLKQNGSAVRYTEYKGTDHGSSAEKAYAEPEVLQWLLAQHR
jgi:predicted peptidase